MEEVSTVSTLSSFLITAGVTFFTSLITWFFARRKNNADAKGAEANAKGSELDNVEKAIAIWRGMAEEFKEQFEAALKINNSLQIELSEIKSQVELLIRENDKLKKMVNKLTKEDNKPQE